MPTANAALAHLLFVSHKLLQRYTADLAPAEYLHRPSPTANCAAWIIGHLILTERRALTMCGVTDLPAVPDGFEKRFSRDEGCAQAAEFGDVAQLMPLFDQHREALIDAVKNALPELLDKPLEKAHPMFATPAEFAGFVALHSTMHAGQITLIRRSLGRPPLV
jgi:hypothetical protein